MRTQPRKHPMSYHPLSDTLRTALQTVALALCLAAATAAAGPLRDRLGRSADASDVEDGDSSSARTTPPQALPPGLRLLRDVAYGPDAQQRMDIYVPDRVQGAPVLFLVHGGGWRRGDKAQDRLVQNKLAHWAAQGVVLVSVNYRMLPEAAPLAVSADTDDPFTLRFARHPATGQAAEGTLTSARGDIRWRVRIERDSQ